MLGKTHARVGMAVAAAIAGHSDAALPLLLLGLVLAQGPDVDHQGSLIGRLFFFWPAVTRRGGPYLEHGRWTPFGVWPHRGPTHSLEATLLVGAVALLLALWRFPEHALLVGAVVWLCYSSHLLTDIPNRSPIMLLACKHWYLRVPRWLTLPESSHLEQACERSLRAICTMIVVIFAGPPLLNAGLQLLLGNGL